MEPARLDQEHNLAIRRAAARQPSRARVASIAWCRAIPNSQPRKSSASPENLCRSRTACSLGAAVLSQETQQLGLKPLPQQPEPRLVAVPGLAQRIGKIAGRLAGRGR